MPKVLNKKTDKIPVDAVYCGRPSKWGNPFIMETEEDRDRVCDLFDNAVLPKLDVSELEGKDLVCWCAPKRCHCDSLLRKARGMVRCVKGHWYPPDTYKPRATTCPVCQLRDLYDKQQK